MRFPFSFFLLLVLPALSLAGEKAPDTPSNVGKVVSIVKKARERVLYYQGNDPITKDDSYYEISILIQGTIYTGEYDPPQFGSDQVADDWKTDEAVVTRVDKHHIYARPPHGRELTLAIIRKRPASTIQIAPNPAP